MWNAPNQRVRAAANAKKRERERSRKPIHIKRITANLQIPTSDKSEPEKKPVRLVLNDLSVKGVGIYSSEALLPGSEILLWITEPKALLVRSKVIWCQEYAATSHILSINSFGFRLGLEFILSTEEENAVKAFCETINKDFIFSVR